MEYGWIWVVFSGYFWPQEARLCSFVHIRILHVYLERVSLRGVIQVFSGFEAQNVSPRCPIYVLFELHHFLCLQHDWCWRIAFAGHLQPCAGGFELWNCTSVLCAHTSHTKNKFCVSRKATFQSTIRTRIVVSCIWLSHDKTTNIGWCLCTYNVSNDCYRPSIRPKTRSNVLKRRYRQNNGGFLSNKRRVIPLFRRTPYDAQYVELLQLLLINIWL